MSDPWLPHLHSRLLLFFGFGAPLASHMMSKTFSSHHWSTSSQLTGAGSLSAPHEGRLEEKCMSASAYCAETRMRTRPVTPVLRSAPKAAFCHSMYPRSCSVLNALNAPPREMPRCRAT